MHYTLHYIIYIIVCYIVLYYSILLYKAAACDAYAMAARGPRGALCLAVYRGKLSEGMSNNHNDYKQVIIIVSIIIIIIVMMIMILLLGNGLVKALWAKRTFSK